jgi:hypothetical protein
LARPLGIKNYSFSYDSRKPFQLERQVYTFSQRQKVISCIGHTHRPLFESLSKEDSLRFELERRLRKFPKLKKEGQRKKAAKIIAYLKSELDHLAIKNGRPKTLHLTSIIRPPTFCPASSIAAAPSAR